jgi:hypothetical protein
LSEEKTIGRPEPRPESTSSFRDLSRLFVEANYTTAAGQIRNPPTALRYI